MYFSWRRRRKICETFPHVHHFTREIRTSSSYMCPRERQTSSPYVRCALHRFKVQNACRARSVIGSEFKMRVAQGDPVHRFRVQNAPPKFEPCYLLFLEATYHRLACIKFNTYCKLHQGCLERSWNFSRFMPCNSRFMPCEFSRYAM